jgi:VWFA-related protein
MGRIFPLIVLTSLLSAFVFFSHARAQQAPQAANEAGKASAAIPIAQAHVLVTISDNQGHLISTPSKDQLVVHDNGRLVEVEEIRSAKDDPIVFSLLVDDSGSTRDLGKLQLETAVKLFRALSSMGNHGYLSLFADNVITSDNFVDVGTVEQTLEPENIPRQGATTLYDAVIHACAMQLNRAKIPESSRRVIFLFSDGGDDASHYSLEQTLKIVQGEGVPVFSVGTSSKPARQLEKQGLSSLRSLSYKTGEDVELVDQQNDVVSQILTRLNEQYVLTFALAPGKPGTFHSLEVKSIVKDVRVSAPTRYFAR